MVRIDFEVGTAVAVAWVDSSLSTGWESIVDREDDDTLVHSIGYFLSATEKNLTLVSSLDNDGMGNGFMTIPRPTVLSIKEVK